MTTAALLLVARARGQVCAGRSWPWRSSHRRRKSRRSPAAAAETPFGRSTSNLDGAATGAASPRPCGCLSRPALGTALALRPRRRGTPARQPAVVQTQIVLAIVGALIMLVVGASLARAFGIVGAANLIRYRSKIDDPKDAVVMLCALSVGLAAGVGLYGLALFGTLFLCSRCG